MKLVCVLADTTWSIGRVHQDIADGFTSAFAGEYEFVFHYDARHYRDKMLADFERCDVFLTTPNLYIGLMDRFKGKNLRKILFIAHYAHDWNFLKGSPFLNEPSYCTISEAITESFPAPCRWTPSGINPALFDYRPRSGKIRTLGWSGNLSWVSKRVDWSYQIANGAGLIASLTVRTPYAEMREWYQTIDVFVVTAGPGVDCETGPLPPFEAVLSGVPVIGTAVGNFRLLPGPKFTTIDEAVAILQGLKANPNRAVALAKEQYDAVMSNWTIQAVLPKWREALDAAIEKGRSSSASPI